VDAAQAHTLTRTFGAAATRDYLLGIVWGDLTRLRGYVQGLADASPQDAAAIIESAGMDVKRSSGHGRAQFKAAKGPNPGSVSLIAQREKMAASYEWQCSLDGVTYVTALWTTKASAILRGLEQGRRYFRMRSVTKQWMGDFGQVITFVVQ
jgi:hypothetical protein